MADKMVNSRMFLLVFCAAILVGCGGAGLSEDDTADNDGQTTTGTTTGDSTADAAFQVEQLQLLAAASAIKSNNSDSTLITVTVLDDANEPIADVPVQFAVENASLNSAEQISDGFGQASVTLTSGLLDFSTRQVTVKATAGGQTVSVNVDIEGINALALQTSATSIESDNEDAAEISAIVTDQDNGVLANVPVMFSASSGTLTATSASTDETGKATVSLSNGASDYSNRTVTVTAIAGDQQVQIPVAITGSTVTLNLSAETIQAGAGDVSFTVSALDAAEMGKYQQNVRLSLDSEDVVLQLGDAQVQTPAVLQTDVQGQINGVLKVPASHSAGDVVLRAEWLDSEDNVSASTEQSLNVTAAEGVALAISAPEADPLALNIRNEQAISLAVPDSVDGQSVAQLRVSASAGEWATSSPVTNGSNVLLVPKAADSNSVQLYYLAPANSGTVTLQIDALDAQLRSLASITRQAMVSATISQNASVSLQTSVSALLPSTVEQSSQAQLTAVVRDELNNAVGNAAVVFELLGTTGSGESLSPVLVNTDAAGRAQTTFTAGSEATAGAVSVRARLIDADCTQQPAQCDTSSLIVAATEEDQLKQLSVAQIQLQASQSSIDVNADDGSTVQLRVLDQQGQPLEDIVLDVSVDDAELDETALTTDAQGRAQVVLTNGDSNFSSRTVTLSAKAGTQTATLEIQINGISVLSLQTTATAIQTDNSDSATINAIVTDRNNGVLVGVPVSFSASSGNLSALQATTDSEGQASVTLTSGASDFSNRTVTVSATAGDQQAQIPVLINGSTVSLALSAETIQVGSGDVGFTVSALDAADMGKYQQNIRLSLDSEEVVLQLGEAQVQTPAVLQTDVQGQINGVLKVPALHAAGDVVLTAEWLDSEGNVSASVEQSLSVTAAEGIALAITAPENDPLALNIRTEQAITLALPDSVDGQEVTQLRVSATAGEWSVGSPVTNGSNVLVVPKAADSNSVQLYYLAPANSGTVTLQIDALDAQSQPLASITRQAMVSAAASQNARVSLQSSANALLPSTAEQSSQLQLSALVRDELNNAVGNAAVVFELLGTTGSGESLSPVLVNTDAAGRAQTIFTAGREATAGAVSVRARLIDADCAQQEAACDTTSLIVAETEQEQLLQLSVAQIQLQASQSSIDVNGDDGSSIQLLVLDQDGQPLEDIALDMSVNDAQLEETALTTDAQGRAQTVLTNGDSNFSSRTVTVTAKAGTQTARLNIQINGISELSLQTTATSIRTDNSDSATISAIVTDRNNGVLANVPVSFLTSSGNLSATSAVTDASGQASVSLISGASDFSNRTATVTANAGNLSESIPILINGSTLSLNLSQTSIQIGQGEIEFNALARDAAGTGKYQQTLVFSIDEASTGAATLSVDRTLTGVQGDTAMVSLTPTAPGSVILQVQWLDAEENPSVTTSQQIDVSAAEGVAFAITQPANDPQALATGEEQELVISIPDQVSETDVEELRISVSGGSLASASPVTGGDASIRLIPVANQVVAYYLAPASSGVMTLQVEALDAEGQVLSSLSHSLVVSAPASQAASLDLQAAVSTLAPSSGGNTSSTELTATVRDAQLNSVGGAAVIFELLGTTGSGESIAPALAHTDTSGKATVTFKAGSESTTGSIYARARLVGEACGGDPLVNPVVTESNVLCDSTALRVAANAVSVAIGLSTVQESVENDTQYSKAGSVLVVDANGSAVPGAEVTLTAFPSRYRNGTIYRDDEDLEKRCKYTGEGFVASEDVNRNGILDAGEDINGNGKMSPPQAAGGAISSATVITGSTGVAGFTLQYPKDSAVFIETEIMASVRVSGSEHAVLMPQVLPISSADDTPCVLGRTSDY